MNHKMKPQNSIIQNTSYNKGFNDGIAFAKRALARDLTKQLDSIKDIKGIGPAKQNKVLELFAELAYPKGGIRP